MTTSINLKLINKKYLILLFFITISTLLFAQQSLEYKTYKEKYPNSNAVRLQQETTIKITLSEGEINISQVILEEDLYLDDTATYGSKRSVNYSSFFEIENIEASSYNFENGKYRESEVKEFNQKDELDGSFYDDTKSINFVYSNLQKGSKSKLKYTEIVKNPRFLSSFYFGDFIPIINNKLTIIVDNDIQLKFKEFNTSELQINYKIEEKRSKTIHTWTTNNVLKYEYETQVPSYSAILPHIVPIISSYKVEGKTINLLAGVEDLYNWYYSLVKNVNTQDHDEELKQIVNQLTQNKENELEKVKAIYYWTQQNIKYIAFEYALGGFVPREANDVFQKKYGDCKDNSSILHEMLEIAGLKGNLTWIGTRSIPYKYTEVPTPIVDNHMILTYRFKDSLYFLDATGRYTPINYPTTFIQGKEALISKGENNFEIKKVPIIPAIKNKYLEFSHISINNDDIEGTTKTILTGYNKSKIFRALELKDSEQQLKDFYIKNLVKGNNSFIISTIKETNKFDYEKEFILDYQFKVANYVKQLNNEIYINLNLYKLLSHFKIEKERENSIEYDYKKHNEYTNTLEIPIGYEVEYLPELIELKNDFITFKTSYKIENNKIIYKNTTILNFIELTKEQQLQVNQIIKKAEKAYKEIIILKKI